MKYLTLPIKCSCKIFINKEGRYELELYDLSHPYNEKGSQAQHAYGKTINDACINLGQGLSRCLFEEVPDPSVEGIL